jgi:hypothetical protein
MVRRPPAPSITVALVLLAGCVDERPGAPAASVHPPEGWTQSTPAVESVPGEPLAAWSGPEGSTLVLYATLGVPDPDARALARELANRFTNMPGADVTRAEAIDGPAGPMAFLEVVAPGDGGRFAPSGLGVPRLESGEPIPTRQVALAHQGPRRTLWLVAHYPEASHDRLGPAVERTLRSWNPAAAGSRAASSPY